jgi:iron complex outermembrane receptor protein
LEANAYLIKGFSVIAGVSYNDMKYTEADETVIGKACYSFFSVVG